MQVARRENRVKKAGVIVSLILIFFLVYFLQSNLFNWFTIAGIKPNVFVILVLFIGLFMGRTYGVCFGILFGFFLDILIGRNLGTSCVMLGCTGFLGGYIDKNFSKDSRIMVMAMVAITTFIYELISYIIQSTILSYYTMEIAVLVKILIIEIIYNIIITIIIYPILKRSGYYIEGIFKESNILTRYF